MKSNFIWINGDFVPQEESALNIFAPTRAGQDMVFEDIRCYETASGPAVFRLEEHLAEFLSAVRASGCEVSYSLENLCGVVHRTLVLNEVHEGNIRPAVYVRSGGGSSAPVLLADEPVLAVAAWEWPSYDEQEMDEWGFGESIVLDTHMLELEQSALFMVREGVIFTSPSAQFGNRIKRDTAITLAHDLGYRVMEQPLSRKQLYAADEIFVNAAVAGVKPVREIDGRVVGEGRVGPVAKALQNAFFETVHGRGPRSVEWLEWVWSSFSGV